MSGVARTGHNGNTAIGFLNKFCYQFFSFIRLCLLPSGEYTAKTRFDTIFQCFERIACHIKGAMTSYFQWSGSFDQFFATLYINSPFICENSKYHSIHTNLLALMDVALHSMELIIRI